MNWAGPRARMSCVPTAARGRSSPTRRAGLGTIGQLYAHRDANKQKEEQALFQLASTLGVLGLGGLDAFGGFGYAR